MTSRLDEIAARSDAANEGPWKVRRDYGDSAATVHANGTSITRCVDCGVEAEYDTQDAEFIAHAREDVPKLVAALRAVEAVHVTKFYDQWGHGHDTSQGRGGWCGNCGRFDGEGCRTITAIRDAL